MALEVTTAVETAAVILVLDLQQDFGPRLFRTLVMGIGVRDHNVRGLGNTTRFLWVAHQIIVLTFTDRAEHDHAGPKTQLGVGDPALTVGYDEFFFEAESTAEPFDCGRRIAIAQAGDYGRYRLFWFTRHGPPP